MPIKFRILPSVLVASLLLGCGGEGGDALGLATTSLDLSVTWPTRGRIIPAASESIRTTVRPTMSLPVVGQRTLTRPATTGRIEGIPVGSHLVMSEALDANGKVVASRTVQMTFLPGEPGSLTLDLDSAIAEVLITPSAPNLSPGDQVALAAAGKNSKGDGVLLTPSKLQWSLNSGEAFGSIAASTGIVTATAPGTIVAKVTDSESGLSATATITVRVSPSMQELEPGSDVASLGQKTSADGEVVVGTTVVNSRAYRWTSGGGTQMLPTLGGVSSSANGVSSDGSVVVGWANIADGTMRAFRWTQAGGMVSLGTLGGTSSQAYGVSSDGAVVVGQAAGTDGVSRPFVWRSATGMQALDSSLGQGSALDASADGTFVVGQALIDGVVQAFRWSQAGGVEKLGSLGGWSLAAAISADGSTVVGTSQVSGTITGAFRWTAATGLKALGTLGGPTSGASDVSADGRVVVGIADNKDALGRAFRWKEGNGMMSLGTLGGSVSTANGISADGVVVVGNSLKPDQATTKAFRQTLP
jgi:probable HAF family extracellular repeat protein